MPTPLTVKGFERLATPRAPTDQEFPSCRPKNRCDRWHALMNLGVGVREATPAYPGRDRCRCCPDDLGSERLECASVMEFDQPDRIRRTGRRHEVAAISAGEQDVNATRRCDHRQHLLGHLDLVVPVVRRPASSVAKPPG
jgi:hypothetical protein